MQKWKLGYILDCQVCICFVLKTHLLLLYCNDIWNSTGVQAVRTGVKKRPVHPYIWAIYTGSVYRA